ncbi:MAG: class I SAM-dependent methyltransferase [Thermoanaerobaculia bacterium]
MDDELRRRIAESLDATPELLPFLPELLADLWTLGCSLETVLDLLRSVPQPALDLPPHETRLLDLGCGKGAIAVSAAAELGFRVHGVDGFEPFIDEARRRAAELGVGELCDLECDDLRATIRTARDYDVVVYASHGPMLDGRPCVEFLRECVRPGGYMIVDDGFLAAGVRSKPAVYEDYLPRDATVTRLTAHGDVIVREVVLSVEELGQENRRLTEKIRRRAEKLAEQRPEAADSIFWYVDNQERECRILEEIHVPAVWLLQRASSS